MASKGSGSDAETDTDTFGNIGVVLAGGCVAVLVGGFGVVVVVVAVVAVVEVVVVVGVVGGGPVSKHGAKSQKELASLFTQILYSRSRLPYTGKR